MPGPEIYIGSELELFASAVNWKRYFSSIVRPALGDSVLEIGAGIGENVKVLASPTCRRWVCVEPDRLMAERIATRIVAGELLPCCEVRAGTIDAVEDRSFSSVVYIDVLEHIEDDKEEIRKAVTRLRPDGRIVVLAPAHQWLFTEFDSSIGHFRRYSRDALCALTPPGFRIERAVYLDSVGLLASIANKLLLHSSMPSRRQIAVWDKMMIPASRVLDPILRYCLGKTIIMIWRQR